MAIIWINIWDSQNRLTAKKLINCCFNVSSFIATIREANMNPGVLQCKNCWKWDHTTFLCYLVFKGLGAWNAIALIKQNIIITLPGAAKLTSRLTPLVLKPNRVNLTSISSNTLTARATTRQTLTLVYSGTIASTKNNMPRNTRNSKRLGPS